MRKKSLLIAMSIFMFVFQNISAQNDPSPTFIVKGILTDSVTSETIPYATVSLSLTSQPDNYIKRLAAGSKGEFELTIGQLGKYLITFESIGMKKQILPINPEKQMTDLGKIELSPANQQLKELAVTASKPLVKADLDKIVYDMKSDPEAKSNTVLEMLKKVPLVTVDGDENIQVKGSSNFKIYMNGKPSNMITNNPAQVLKSIPASSIKNIEVITEPGAKYDAEGLGGIINIITERSLSGLTGSVRAGIDSRGGNNGGLYISSKKGKFGLTANLNYDQSNTPGYSSYSLRENLVSSSTKYTEQSSTSNSSSSFKYGTLEASYEFDSLNLVTLSMSGYIGDYSSKSEGLNYMYNDVDTIAKYLISSNTGGDWGGYQMSLDYQRTFKKPDQLLTLSYRLSRSPDNSDNVTATNGLLNYADYKQRITSYADGDEHTFQIDYNEPFNKKHVMEVGLKYIIRLNNSKNTYYLFDDTANDWTINTTRDDNDLDQKQYILGAYGSYTLKLDKFNFRVGGRLENTYSDVALSDTSFNYSFFNLVPSLSVTYRLSTTSNLKLSYNQRISRPGIWYLNPFVDDTNPMSISYGNPNLDPEIDNSISVNFSSFSQKLNFNTSIFGSYTNNSIERISKSLNDSVIATSYYNIGSRKNIGWSTYFNWNPTKKIRWNLNGNLNYTQYSTNDGSGIENSGITYSLSTGAQFTLPKEFKFGMNGGYYSPRINLQGHSSGYYYYSASFSREFFKKKLNVSLSASNPFQKYINYNSYTETSSYIQNSNNQRLARYFNLSLSYRFGEMKEQIKKVQKSISNDDVKSGGSQSGEN